MERNIAVDIHGNEVDVESEDTKMRIDWTHIRGAMNEFQSAMKDRMYEKHQQGFTGWEDASRKNEYMLRLATSAAKENWVDVANFAMMLDNIKRGER